MGKVDQAQLAMVEMLIRKHVKTWLHLDTSTTNLDLGQKRVEKLLDSDPDPVHTVQTLCPMV